MAGGASSGLEKRRGEGGSRRRRQAMKTGSNEPEAGARAFVRCDRCGDFVPFNPRDIRASLGEAGPRHRDCAPAGIKESAGR